MLTTGRALQFLFLAAAVALPGAAKPRHAPKPPDICICDPPPTAHPLPSAEALALARRIVKAVDGAIIWHRVRELVAEAEQRETPGTPPPSRMIQAVPTLQLSRHPAWDDAIQQRLVDHAALIYASRYSLDELRQMAAFLDSRTGEKFLADRQLMTSEVSLQLRSHLLDDDLWNVVCGNPVPTTVYDGPHHEFGRLHPEASRTAQQPRPAWCPAPGR